MIGAMDGAEAIELAARELPCVVIMDILMPGTDGVTAIGQLKKADTTKTIPIVAISAYPEYHHLRQQLTISGADCFLPKLFSPAKLVAEICRLDSGKSAPQITTE